jgi:anaerobic C4-dicarboxylate transporter DcuA
MIFLQLVVILICIFTEARMSGIGLGVVGMIGKYLLNQSFMLPGLVTTAAALITGLILQSILL